MPIEIQKHDAEWCLRLCGNVDLFEVADLHHAAIEALRADVPCVRVDLAEVEALDTAASQVIVALLRSLAEDGRELRLEGTPVLVHEGWSRIGLDRIFD
jgi:anti-anti-sigma regulatory factor